MTAKKDRLLHPRGFLESTMKGWEGWERYEEAHRLTSALLEDVERANMAGIKRFYAAERDDIESRGCAFAQVVRFAKSYIERYDGAPRHVGAILEVLRNSRAALTGTKTTDRLQVLSREDGADPVAFLATVGRNEGDLVIPLREGKSFVGRELGSRPFGIWPRPYSVEQAQWFIECRASIPAPSAARAMVSDASSTNQSFLVPNKLVPTVDITDGRCDFDELLEIPGATPIPHPNEAADQHTFELRDGDVLCSLYAAFVFSWL